MPIQNCSKDGKSGYKWGDSGTCYTGPGAKKKALKQGQAIELSKQRHGKKSEFDKASFNSFSKEEQVEICREVGMTTAEIAKFLLDG